MKEYSLSGSDAKMLESPKSLTQKKSWHTPQITEVDYSNTNSGGDTDVDGLGFS